MRSHFPILFCAFLFGGCASHGVIVQKEERPHPLYLSIGVEGVYAFILRDETGATFRQMVTPDVFDRYNVGDNFSDESPPPATNDVREPKAAQVAMNRPVPSGVAIANPPVETKPQTATKPKVAHKSQSKTTKIASTKKKAPHARTATKSLEEDLAATPAKEPISGPTKTSKPWRLGAPNLEMTTGNSTVVVPPPGNAPPPAPVEVPIPKPTPAETQVEIPGKP